MTIGEFINLSICVGSGIVVGYLVRKLLMPVLFRTTSKTKWTGDDLIINSVNHWIIAWFVVLGIYLGTHQIKLDPQYIKWTERAILIFYTYSIAWILSRVLSELVRVKAENDDARVNASSSIISNIIKVIIYCVGILFVLQSFGISIGPILGALGVGGLAVALALQDTLSNLFAGIQIIATKKINNGDLVRLDSGQEGFIQDISWRYTTLRTGDNTLIIIPNSKLSQLVVSNYFLPDKEAVVNIPFGVDYNSDLDKVERVTIEVIKSLQEDMDECVPNFDPFVRYHQFGDSSIDIRAFIKVREWGAQHIVKHHFIKRLKKRFQEENINIPFPVRTIHITKE